jgi:hypothetical protein
MQDPQLFQVVGRGSDGTQVVLSRHAFRELAERVAEMLDAEGYRQIQIEAEDDYCQRAA